MQTSNVVTLNVQLAVLPDVSVAVQVTVVVPTLKHEPEGGLHDTITPGQLSVAVGGGKLTTTHGVVPAGGQTAWFVTAVMLAGQAMFGGCVSLTVTVNAQAGPAAVEQLTVVEPVGKNEPLAGEQVTVPQLSPVIVGAG